MRHLPVRVLLAIAALGVLLALPASAVQSSVDLLLDLDNDAATGCTVMTVDGPFDGVEQILRTTVDTVGTSAADVTSVERLECTDPGTDTFGAPLPVDPGSWPVGVGLGLDGFHVVETYFPLSATSIDPKVVRIGVVHSRDPEADTLLVATPGTSDPILLDLRSVLEVPTLGEWGLILLAALLAAASLHRLGRRGVAVLVLVLAVGTAGLAWAQCVLDGDPGDWSSGDLLGADPAAADDGISIRAIFGRGEPGELCFRIDLSLQFDQPPTISDVVDQSIPEDGSTGALAFTVGDLEDAPGSLLVTATSSNQILVPDANLTLGGSGANRTIDVTPAANQNGMTVVTLTVQDSAGNTAQTSFMVTVTSVNDPPTISAIGDQVILEDSGTGPLAFTVGDTETAATSLVTSATSSNTTIIPNANLVIVGSGANRTITVTPAADQNGGPVTIDVVVQDLDGGSTPESFTVTVTPVNDAPSFTLAGNVMSDEDAGAQNVPNQATAISAGPANEAGQAITFSVTNDNNALFSAQPAIDASGTLTYTSAANANGSATVTVQAMDNGGTANGGVDTSATQMFTITVNAVNDPPMVVGEVFDVAAGNFDPAIGNTTLQFADSDTVTHPHVYVAGNVLANDSDTDGPSALSITTYDAASAMGGTVSMTLATGEFTYEPPLGYEGSDSFTYTVTDGVTSAVGTVTLEVSGMVWYLDNQTDGTGDDGRAGSPFDTITQLEAVNGNGGASDPAAGDIIFVHTGSGTYDAGIGNPTGLSLLSGQKLWGEGFGLTVLGKTLVPAGSRPSIDNTNSGGDGVTVLANAVNGDRSGVEIRGLTVNGDDNAIDVSAADTNNLDIALSDNVLSSAGGASLSVDGSGSTGTTVVTELGGTGVTTSGTAGGEHFESVTFDADPVTAGIQPVSAGDVAVGNQASPGDVTGPGVLLNNVRGNLQLGNLTIGNTAGPGLLVRDADGKMGTFALSTTGGTIHTVNAQAIDIDPVALAMTLDNVAVEVTAGSVPFGISLDTVSGTFQVTGTTSITATTGTISDGIDVLDTSAAVTFSGPTTISTTTGSGIYVNTCTGPFTVSSTMSSISGAAGPALLVNQGTGNVTYNGSITNTDGRSVEITNHGGSGGGSTIAVAGGVTDTGTGILLDNNDQGAGGTVINLTGALSLTTTGSDAFTATNGGTVNVTDPMTNNQITTTTGTGVTITDTTIGGSGVKFTTVNVGDANPAAPNAANGILLTNVGSNPFTATGGAIQNVTARGVDVQGGSGNVNAGPTISTTTTGRSLEVTGHTGGVVSILGAIDDNGLGVNLDSNMGATINIVGGMDIDTVGANNGFNATNGGMVSVMGGIADVDTSLGTGVAVNIADATIGGGGVTFRSVSANGAPSGIVLNNTGTSGGFTISGDGSDTLGGNDSGGVIQNTTGDAVVVNNSQDLLIANLRIAVPGGDGFDVDQIGGTANRLDNVTVRDADVANTSAVRIDQNAKSFNLTADRSVFDDCDTGQVVFLAEFQGAYSSQLDVEDSVFSGLDGDAISVVGSLAGAAGDTGTITHNFLRNTVRDSDTDGVSVANFSCAGQANCIYNIQDNVFQNLAKLGNFNGGLVNVGYSGLPVSGGSYTATISGNRIEATDGASTDHRRGINVILEPSSGTVPDFDVTVDDNDVNDLGNREALYLSLRSAVTTSNVKVTNNRFGTGNFGTTAGNIGGTRDCVFAETTNVAGIALNLLLENNTIQCDASLSDSTLDVDVRNGSRINLTMRGNTISSSGTATAYIDAGPFSDSGTICLDMNAANVGADANSASPDFVLEQTGGTFHVEGMGAGPNNAAAVEAFLDPRNNNDVTATGTGFTNNGGVACPEPP